MIIAALLLIWLVALPSAGAALLWVARSRPPGGPAGNLSVPVLGVLALYHPRHRLGPQRRPACNERHRPRRRNT